MSSIRCTNRTFTSNSVSSLLSLSLHATIKNIHCYVGSVEYLPKHIKNRMLKSMTATDTYWKQIGIKTILRKLVHNDTKFIDLTSVQVDDDILQIISVCHNLIELNMPRTRCALTTNGLLTAFSNLKKLMTLRIANCSAVTDEFVKYLTSNCPNLICLDIGGSENITDNSFNYLSKLEHLKGITLSNTKISSIGISALVNGPSGPNLRELQMANCNGITNEALILITCKCTNLETLIYNNCSSMTDDVTCSTIENANLKNLKQLTWSVTW